MNDMNLKPERTMPLPRRGFLGLAACAALGAPAVRADGAQDTINGTASAETGARGTANGTASVDDAQGTATAAPSAGTGAATLPPWKKGTFQIHLIHTGVGESTFLIFPDGTTMLLDCGDHAAVTRQDLAVPVVPGPGRLAGEWVARYVKRVNPNGDRVDYMEATHWHADHCGTPKWQSAAPGVAWWKYDYVRSGFGLAAEQLHFAKAIDRGWPDYDDPIPLTPKDLVAVRDHMKKLYAHLGTRDGLTVEKFRLGAHDQIVPLKGRVKGFDVFNLCANGKIALPDGGVKNVYAAAFANGAKPGYLNENGLSLGHVFTYGKFRYYTAGDFSDHLKTPGGGTRMIEDDLAEAVGPVSAAKMNHHGHWSMPGKLIRALRPKIWLACVWDQLHTVPDTLTRLANRAYYGGRTDVLLAPGVFPEPRRTKEAGKPYFRDLAPECLGTGCHVVLTVPPGGATFDVAFVTAADESMRVLGTRQFVS